MGALGREAPLSLSNAPEAILEVPVQEDVVAFLCEGNNSLCCCGRRWRALTLLPRLLAYSGALVAVVKCPGWGDHTGQQRLPDGLQRLNLEFLKNL